MIVSIACTDMDGWETPGERLRNRREELDLTGAELARRLHVTRAAVCDWEADRRCPSVYHLHDLAVALGCTMDLLWTGKECRP